MVDHYGRRTPYNTVNNELNLGIRLTCNIDTGDGTWRSNSYMIYREYDQDQAEHPNWMFGHMTHDVNEVLCTLYTTPVLSDGRKYRIDCNFNVVGNSAFSLTTGFSTIRVNEEDIYEISETASQTPQKQEKSLLLQRRSTALKSK
jgi:hypothetical protein